MISGFILLNCFSKQLSKTTEVCTNWRYHPLPYVISVEVSLITNTWKFLVSHLGTGTWQLKRWTEERQIISLIGEEKFPRWRRNFLPWRWDKYFASITRLPDLLSGIIFDCSLFVLPPGDSFWKKYWGMETAVASIREMWYGRTDCGCQKSLDVLHWRFNEVRFRTTGNQFYNLLLMRHWEVVSEIYW